jgi:hypothetical protein
MAARAAQALIERQLAHADKAPGANSEREALPVMEALRRCDHGA